MGPSAALGYEGLTSAQSPHKEVCGGNPASRHRAAKGAGWAPLEGNRGDQTSTALWGPRGRAACVLGSRLRLGLPGEERRYLWTEASA